ncbi:MAG: hypothetical protein PHX16_05070 [Syntrophaceticus sp.]|jgi:hypothetical protein|nr:hypothetical protein [Syntrophaceticus sp.]MDD3314061.1 hypothetical protein [Syntrophaceticus sp.]MDD4359572.1 hypothetical protein [Syntrophaceticus sp.]MDD4782992.1 hypothetical protein [Syntrophaceticus sp.]
MKEKIEPKVFSTFGSILLAIENVSTISMAWERRNWRKSSWWKANYNLCTI